MSANTVPLRSVLLGASVGVVVGVLLYAVSAPLLFEEASAETAPASAAASAAPAATVAKTAASAAQPATAAGGSTDEPVAEAPAGDAPGVTPGSTGTPPPSTRPPAVVEARDTRDHGF